MEHPGTPLFSLNNQTFHQFAADSNIMVYALKVFKKTSPNGKVCVYLGKRDFIDNITKIESVGM